MKNIRIKLRTIRLKTEGDRFVFLLLFLQEMKPGVLRTKKNVLKRLNRYKGF